MSEASVAPRNTGVLPWVRLTAVVVVIASLTAALGWPAAGQQGPDSEWYISMAEGRFEGVIQPYASRILHPAAARLLRSNGLSTETAFKSLSLASLVFFAAALAFLVQRHAGLAWLAIPLLFSPFLLGAFERIYLGDLFHAALLAAFFLLMKNRRMGLALAVLFLAQLAREWTALLAFCFAVLAFRERRPRLALAAIAISALAWTAVHLIIPESTANRHSLGGAAYLAAKFLFNTCRHYLGFEIYVDTLANCEPIWRTAVPAWLPSGAIQQAGLCAFSAAGPLQTLGILLSLFGILPAALLALLIRFRRDLGEWPFFFKLCLMYGIASFLIGPASGTGMDRLAGYGWPAFWVAAPALLARSVADRQAAVKLLAAHQFLLWAPYLTTHSHGWIELAVWSATIGLNLIAFLWVRRQFETELRPVFPGAAQ